MHNSRDTSSSDQQSIAQQDDYLQNTSQLRTEYNLKYLIFSICLGSLEIGYCITITNLFLQIVDQSSYSDDKKYLINSSFSGMVPLGGCIGCLIIISKVFRIGRRIILIFADFIQIAGCLISILIICCSDEHVSDSRIMIGMFFIGLSVGINSTIIPVYLLEYAPCFSGTGRVIITHHFFVILGIAISFVWGVFIKQEQNEDSSMPNYTLIGEIFYILPIALSSIRLILLFFVFKKDTPFFYLQKNLKEKARKIISLFYVEQQADKILEIFEIKQARQMEGSTKLKDMIQPRYLRRVLISCLMNFFCYFSGVFFFLFYSCKALDSYSNDKFISQYRTLIIGAVLLFTQVFQIPFAKLMGRKTILLIGQICYIIGFIGLSSTSELEYSSKLNIITLFMCIVCIGFCFQSSVIPVIINEILPERGVAAVNFISLVSILIGAITYPSLLNQDAQFIFYLSSLVFNIAGFMLLYYFVKETRGLTNYQIEKIFTSNFHGQIKDQDDSDDQSRNLVNLSC
ncbi:MFS transporter (macronuclear) [Tetrahymena thermophila SB210]|uniref:MFS transporter n=1 Tax=Tetrahymena thermophila (strain SB210) TaxID=312017 RepID=I7MFY1_TETTS|nr:MFS transporter [Tetrahymena thermophila SB210]EAR84482.2 MFS transporter [Tetrahymena thermophila SB210]|eukprot:XP_001032145.2 MFS transporter [Tetrahymena thermophila SB210]